MSSDESMLIAYAPNNDLCNKSLLKKTFARKGEIFYSHHGEFASVSQISPTIK